MGDILKTRRGWMIKETKIKVCRMWMCKHSLERVSQARLTWWLASAWGGLQTKDKKGSKITRKGKSKLKEVKVI